tara:strand:- start:75 stop:386 length:312 start_codon:yes stop_codon:yes gene_type:complete
LTGTGCPDDTGLKEKDRVLDKNSDRVLDTNTEIPGLQERNAPLNNNGSRDDSMVESITHLATAKAKATPNLNSVVDRATKDLVQLLAQQVLDTKPGTCFVGTQ